MFGLIIYCVCSVKSVRSNQLTLIWYPSIAMPETRTALHYTVGLAYRWTESGPLGEREWVRLDPCQNQKYYGPRSL